MLTQHSAKLIIPTTKSQFYSLQPHIIQSTKSSFYSMIYSLLCNRNTHQIILFIILFNKHNVFITVNTVERYISHQHQASQITRFTKFSSVACLTLTHWLSYKRNGQIRCHVRIICVCLD